MVCSAAGKKYIIFPLKYGMTNDESNQLHPCKNMECYGSTWFCMRYFFGSLNVCLSIYLAAGQVNSCLMAFLVALSMPRNLVWNRQQHQVLVARLVSLVHDLIGVFPKFSMFQN